MAVQNLITGEFQLRQENGILVAVDGIVSADTSGTIGTSGTSGTSGSSGFSGTSGSSGSSGTDGTNGTSGSSGSSGTNGTNGTSGSNGSNGTSGLSGTSGTSGTSGSNGSNGTSGTSGTSGVSGTSGTDGSNGTSGSSGTDGTSGTSGTDGTSGTSGSNGSSGTDGTGGTSGSSGTSGVNGTSGTDGTSGTSGTTGTSGTDGSAGTSGSSGTSGTDGTSGSSGTDGTSGTSGSSGTAGTSGVSGVSGGQVYWINQSVPSSPLVNSDRELSPIPTNTITQTVSATISSGVSAVISTYMTDGGVPGLTTLPGGNWSFTTHYTVGNVNATFDVYGKVYKYTTGGVSTLLGTTNLVPLVYSALIQQLYYDTFITAQSLNVTDRIYIELWATNTSNQSHTITFYTEDSQYYSYVQTTFNAPSGTSGTSGTTGTSGSSGTDGTSGTSGTSGLTGSNGTSGSSGTDGSAGTSGSSGTTGTSGTSGTSGSAGTSGSSFGCLGTSTNSITLPPPFDFSLGYNCQSGFPPLIEIFITSAGNGTAPYYYGGTLFTSEAAALANTSWNLYSAFILPYIVYSDNTYWVAMKDTDNTIVAKSIRTYCFSTTTTTTTTGSLYSLGTIQNSTTQGGICPASLQSGYSTSPSGIINGAYVFNTSMSPFPYSYIADEMNGVIYNYNTTTGLVGSPTGNYC